MNECAFIVYISWFGDDEPGKKMEQIVRAVYSGSMDDESLLKNTDLKKVERLRGKLPGTHEFVDYKLFGNFEETHVMYFKLGDGTEIDPLKCFTPLFKEFKDLLFLIQCQKEIETSGDPKAYYTHVYDGGIDFKYEKEIDPYDDNAYAEQCEKGNRARLEWLAGNPSALDILWNELEPGDNYEDWHKQFWLNQVRENGPKLKEVPERLKTPEICLAAVTQPLDDDDFMTICTGIPEEYWADKEFAAKAFIADMRIAPFIEKELITADLYIASIKAGNSLSYVPEKSRTPEICLAAITEECFDIEHVPEELKTLDLCLAAIRQDGRMLKYTPDALKTLEICLPAVQQDSRALNFVPEKIRTKEMCLAAVQQNGLALQAVPEHIRTAEICLAAVQQREDALEFVPEHLKAEVERLLKG